MIFTYTGGRLPAITAATIPAFIDWATTERLVELDPTAVAKSGALYAIYLTWWSAHRSGPAPSDRSFGMAMTVHGSPSLKGTAGVRLRGGIRTI